MDNTDEHKSCRPEDTDFKQQRLKAWQPILTPWWVVGTFMVLGVVFIPLGVSLKDASDGVVEYVQPYDPVPETESKCSGVEYTNDPKSGHKTCQIKFNVKQTMTPPVYVYYELDHFYQNHRQYVKSRADAQLRGESGSNVKLTNCDPLQSLTATSDNVKYTINLVPCGLIANSLFNDTFKLTSPQTLKLAEDGIAWKSDLTNKFKNTGFVKYGGTPGATANCKQDAWGGFSDCTCPDGHKTCNKYLNQSYPGVIGADGVENEHFVVWMRTAGLPKFRKLYGIIHTEVKEGTTLTFDVKANFPVKPFNGKKALVIATTSWIGGKNPFLGTAYIVVGAICLFLGAAFAIKQKRYPRKMGDTSSLTWATQAINDKAD